MSRFSPAYQFNYLVLSLVGGSVVDHAYTVLVVTVFLTQGHRIVLRNLYCY